MHRARQPEAGVVTNSARWFMVSGPPTGPANADARTSSHFGAGAQEFRIQLEASHLKVSINAGNTRGEEKCCE